MTVKITLSATLKRLEEQGITMTKNAIAVEAKVRPSTLSDLAKENTKAIKLETLDEILEAMHRLAPTENFTIEDIVKYERTQD